MARLRRPIHPSDQNEEPITHKHLWEFRFFIDFFWLLLILFALIGLYSIRGLLTPLIIAFVLAYLFNPVIRYMNQQWKLSRPFSVTLLLLLLIILVLVLSVLLLPLIVEQTANFAKDLPGYAKTLSQQLTAFAHGLIQYLPEFYQTEFADAKTTFAANFNVQKLTDQVAQQLENGIQTFKENPFSALASFFSGTGKTFGAIGKGTSKAIGFIGNVISSTGFFVLNLFLIPVFFFFIAWEFNRMLELIVGYLPSSKKERIIHIAQKMDKAIIGFFFGRILVSLIMGVMFAVGWWIGGVPYWFVLGMLTGLFDIVPYLSAIGWPVAILFKYLDTIGQDYSLLWLFLTVFLWPSIVYVGVQLCQGWVLTPWIQSQSTDLNMALIAVVVFIGGAIWGFTGLFIAIPLAACLKIFWNEVIGPRLKASAKNS